MVKTGYLYLCNHDFVDGQINLVLRTNYLDVIWWKQVYYNPVIIIMLIWQ